MFPIKLKSAIKKTLCEGGIIAYPTESIWGLGADPHNETAVMRILKIKKRDVKKGLILIAANFAQIKPFIKTLPKNKLAKILKTWPGPTTWVLPASKNAPKWITGAHDSIAVRITSHKIAKEICKIYGKAIVSTSANISNQKPAHTKAEVLKALKQFKTNIDLIIPGKTGGFKKPSQIISAKTGEIIRF